MSNADLRELLQGRLFVADGKVYDIDDAVLVMDDDLREQLHAELAPCSAQQFADRYDAAVSPAGSSWEWLTESIVPDRTQALERLSFDAAMAADCGYVAKTTAAMDFETAEHFGRDAIRDTYEGAISSYGGDASLMAELVFVLNHLIWQHWLAGDEPLARLYDALWREAEEHCFGTFDGDDLAKCVLRTLD